MVQFLNIPGPQYPTNALLDFSPMSNALDRYRQGSIEAAQSDLARQAGELAAKGDYTGAAGVFYRGGMPAQGVQFSNIPLQRNALMADIDLKRQQLALQRQALESARLQQQQDAALAAAFGFGPGGATTPMPTSPPPASAPATSTPPPSGPLPSVPGVSFYNPSAPSAPAGDAVPQAQSAPPAPAPTQAPRTQLRPSTTGTAPSPMAGVGATADWLMQNVPRAVGNFWRGNVAPPAPSGDTRAPGPQSSAPQAGEDRQAQAPPARPEPSTAAQALSWITGMGTAHAAEPQRVAQAPQPAPAQPAPVAPPVPVQQPFQMSPAPGAVDSFLSNVRGAQAPAPAAAAPAPAPAPAPTRGNLRDIFSRMTPENQLAAFLYLRGKKWDDLAKLISGQTAGTEAADKEVAKELASWNTGGAADVERQINQLSRVVQQLQSGSNLTGPFLGNLPDRVAGFVNPQGLAVRQQVEEVVQRSLRQILGGQFTEREAMQLVERAFDPKLEEGENLRRVNALLAQIAAAAAAKNSLNQHFQQYGTMRGWQGRVPTWNDFYSVLETPQANASPGNAAPAAAPLPPGTRLRYNPATGALE